MSRRSEDSLPLAKVSIAGVTPFGELLYDLLCDRTFICNVTAGAAKQIASERGWRLGYIVTAVNAVLALAPCPFCGGLPPGEASSGADLCSCEDAP